MEERPEGDRYCKTTVSRKSKVECPCRNFRPNQYVMSLGRGSSLCTCKHSISDHEFRTDQQIGDFMAQELSY